jgi:hypothetical protein
LFNLAAYLGLIASIFTAFFSLLQAYILLTEENKADGSILRKEMFLKISVARTCVARNGVNAARQNVNY